ncbi:hypothetical protein SLG_10670 [Sphingobium sp. SYK-6]|uniref:hypothetical protein n=1 Tax=Sphingobium sp. (strain NBRC 103272 / SYK-6) TaxID=627192 RepID=UPI00022766ED|nr:hypothetical protein [Sphingobium sp. SYK-6]BAK65742.1 hypothetical protein SLG_10670 [Sphingobium sp. SYK-6]
MSRPAFDPVEQAVIVLATSDPLIADRRPGLLARLFGAVDHPVSLANARLEALRQLVVRLRHEPLEYAVREVDAAIEAGFTVSQVQSLVERFALPCGDGSRRYWHLP